MNEILNILKNNLDDANAFSHKLQDPAITKHSTLDSELKQLIVQLGSLETKITNYRNELDTFTNLKKVLSDVLGNIKILFDNIKASNSNNFSNLHMKTQIDHVTTALDLIHNFRHNYHFVNQVIEVAINQKIEVAEQKLKKIDQLTNKLQGVATEKVYEGANTRYEKRYKKLEFQGYCTIGLSIISTVIFLIIYSFHKNLLSSLIALKVTILLVAIFLITYYFKQATHYRKLADIAEQRHLELEAIPSFLSTISDQAQNEVRKELALKYFGQPLDETHYSSTESLIQDQIKSSTEVLKMTTSLLKSERLNLNTTNDHESNPKPNSL